MERLTENKVLLIVRRTRLDELIRRFNTLEQARFYIEHLGGNFRDYVDEDRKYKEAVGQAQEILAQLGRFQMIDRAHVPNFIFGERDTVVVLGQDGLVANVLKYLNAQPVIGLNPDPDRWEGVLLPFRLSQLRGVALDVFSGKRPVRQITMAQARLNTGQTLLGVNDIFIGQKTHTSARYALQLGEHTEEQSSSGVIVSTGLGSTGWLRSILAGATGIVSKLTDQKVAPQEKREFRWDANYLYFSVREPWPSKTSSAAVTFGRVTRDIPLNLISRMPENGVIFSDGMEGDFLEFNAGTQAVLTLAEKQGRLVV